MRWQWPQMSDLPTLPAGWADRVPDNWRSLGAAAGVGLLIGFLAGVGWSSLGSDAPDFATDLDLGSDQGLETEEVTSEMVGRDPLSEQEWSEGAITGTSSGGSTVPEVPTPALGLPAPVNEVSERREAATPPGRPRAASPRVSPPSPPAGSTATTAPAASEARGRVLVRTSPAGTDVTVNGIVRGVSPLVLRDLTFGTYEIEVTRAGYRPELRTLTVSTENPAAAVTIELRPNAEAGSAEDAPGGPAPVEEAAGADTGSVYLESQPREALVRVDGVVIGMTPLLVSQVAPGAREIRIEREGYRVWTSTVDVMAGTRSRILASLEVER